MIIILEPFIQFEILLGSLNTVIPTEFSNKILILRQKPMKSNVNQNKVCTPRIEPLNKVLGSEWVKVCL